MDTNIIGKLYRLLASRLKVRLIASFLMLTLSSVGLAAAIGYYQAYTALQEAAFDRLEAVADTKRTMVEQWLTDQRRDTTFLAWLPIVRHNLETLLDTTDPDLQEAAYDEISTYFTTFLVNQADLREIFILSVEGRVLLSTTTPHEGRLDDTQPYFQNARQNTATLKIYTIVNEAEPTLTLATPIVEQGRQLGILVVHLNTERLNRLILREESVSVTMQTYLIGRSDDTAQLLAPSQAHLNDRATTVVTSEGARRGLQGQDGQALYVNAEGSAVIGVYRWLPEAGVTLLTELSQAEAFAPARLLAVNIGLVGVGLAVVLTIMIYLLARSIAQPILIVTEAARRVTMGDLTREAPVTTQDEIGELTRVFNTMQQGWRRSQQELKLYTQTLEERVAARTTDLETANQMLSYRTNQLELSIQVGWQATSILKLDDLLGHIVTLIQTKFDYYFVGVWLLDDSQQRLVLQAGVGHTVTNTQVEGMQIAVNSVNSIIVQVCQTKQSHLASDIKREPRYLSIAELIDARSELVLPMKIGARVIGVLDIQNDKPNTFVPEDLKVFQSLANQVGIAIRNAQLYQTEQQRREFAEALQNIGRTLASSLDIKTIPDQILHALRTVVPYDRGLILLAEDAMLNAVAQTGFPLEHQGRQFQIQIQNNQDDIFLQLSRTARPLVIDDVVNHAGWQQMSWLPVHHSWLGVPLIASDKTIGMISLTRTPKNAFSQHDADIVLTFAGQAAIALENARLHNEVVQINEQLEQRVTERTAELHQAYKLLAQLDQTKSDFIKVSSHELRTPLTVISGYAQMLAVNPIIRQDDNMLALLKGITSGTERLHRIVNSMLDAAKIDSDALEISLEAVSLAPIIETIELKLAEGMAQRNISLRVTDIDTLPTLQADPDLLQKLFYNLIINAVKYTPDGGQVAVTGQQLADAVPPQIEVTVRDTGIGIDREHHNVIFEKFYQTGQLDHHSSGDTKFKGAGPGLGLAIAKGIVEGHHGQIWVESQGYDEASCHGSTFYIRLPIDGINHVTYIDNESDTHKKR